MRGPGRSLTLTQGVLTAKWTSKKCDYLDGEVTDLVISVHRGMTAGPQLIKGERTCGGKVNTYSLTGKRFEQYRTGHMNDLETPKGIKYTGVAERDLSIQA